MIRSPFADVAIPDISLYDSLFADLSEEELERIAIIDGVSGAETSYRIAALPDRRGRGSARVAGREAG